MEQKFNDKDDSTKQKSIDDFERRGHAEKSRAAEQQKRTRVLNGPRLFRDVMIKLGLQRKPAEREHINTKAFEASVSLERLTSIDHDHEREEQQSFEPSVSNHLEETAEFKAYERGLEAGENAQELGAEDLKDPDVVEGYVRGLEMHISDLRFARDIDGFEVPDADFERAEQLWKPAYEQSLVNMNQRDLEIKSDGPELDR
ncbi:hypothetical protein [Alcaligenes faecalis]|uniref:Uncharacterized protein n=1 Tax=Alcaligenes faecalis TaxID=511 RepID=A0AB33CX13_ALCFA|nr:hypothetical protein [Alcaligenes faecalis]ASR90160.1 hypothetical protein AFA_12255 [Alcaligenes faecalis]